MAKETAPRSSVDQNAVRRAAKDRKAAHRKAEAAQRKRTQANYRAGFEFKHEGSLAAVLARQDLQRQYEEGRKMNQLINHWLDQVDEYGTHHFGPVGLDGWQLQAFNEMMQWVATNPNYAARPDNVNGGIIVGHIKKETAAA